MESVGFDSENKKYRHERVNVVRADDAHCCLSSLNPCHVAANLPKHPIPIVSQPNRRRKQKTDMWTATKTDAQKYMWTPASQYLVHIIARPCSEHFRRLVP